MREQVGRAIGLSARKVQVRSNLLILICITDLSITQTSGLVPGEYFFCSPAGNKTYLLPIHRISVRKPGGRVIARIRVLPQRLRAHRSTAPFLMYPPPPFYTLRHLPRSIPPMSCIRPLIPHPRLLFSSMGTEGSSSNRSPLARAVIYLVQASLEQYHPLLSLLRVSHKHLRCRRLRRTLTLVLQRDHH